MQLDPRTLAIPLTAWRFSTLPEDSNGGHCAACGVFLDLHQPDAGLPDRLVGVCGSCGRWYLIDFLPERDEALMVVLPEREAIRQAHMGSPP